MYALHAILTCSQGWKPLSKIKKVKVKFRRRWGLNDIFLMSDSKLQRALGQTRGCEGHLGTGSGGEKWFGVLAGWLYGHEQISSGGLFPVGVGEGRGSWQKHSELSRSFPKPLSQLWGWQGKHRELDGCSLSDQPTKDMRKVGLFHPFPLKIMGEGVWLWKQTI